MTIRVTKHIYCICITNTFVLELHPKNIGGILCHTQIGKLSFWQRL